MSAAPAREYSADALLRDGRSVMIRAIRPEDKERLLAHFHGLGPDSLRFRFLGAKKELTPADLRYFTELDFERHVGLVVSQRHDGGEEFIGVGRYVRGDDAHHARAAEFALAVTDPWQGRGVGTLLLEHLARVAAGAGIERFQADILEGNTRMLDVLAGLGFRVEERSRDGVVRAWFEIEPNPDALRASDERAWRAAAESVRALLHPRSVAVVGASRQPGTIGAALVANLVRHGFRGPIYPVNPKADTIEGLPAYPGVQAIGKPVDLGVIAVPAPAVEAAVADCASAGARGVVVISAGFAESSAAGRAAQGRLRDLVRASGMRMVGPNCMGVLNADPEVSLNATFAPTFPPAGNVAMLSQSGALGLAILDYARDLDIGLSTFVSVGNKADVSGNDLLAYWKEDPRTAVIALYLESFGNPRRFARWAPDVARKKPVVAVKSGRSAAGTRAASSHSAALACLDVAVDALFEQAGVIRTDTLEDMFDVVTLLATQPVPTGPRVGVVTNAGGPGILLADACEARGLTLPELTADTVAALRGFLPAAAGLKNPVDMIASASPEQFARTIEAVGADPNVDSLVVIYVPPMVTNAAEIAAAVARGAGTVPAPKPVLSVFLSTKGAPAALAGGPRGKLPSYSFPENAARALAAAERYGRWRARPRGDAVRLEPAARETARGIVERAMAGHEGDFWLEPADAEAVLRAAGIPLAASRIVPPDDAVAAADTLGYPLVAKAVSRRLLHKSDVGGVMLGLTTADEVKGAVRLLRGRVEAAGHPLEAVLLQRQVSGGLEALVGVVGDPTFGPLVVCGLGGVQVELLRDASFRMPPVTDLDAREMIDRLRLKALFDGYRGSAPADRPALESLIQRVSALVEALPELRELDLNPVKVLRPGEGVVVVDARVRVGTARPEVP
ncbi:MAG TPA: GNAT family N-acetyltransferase [Vicinamibacteria bacterium]|nr:GNAT family N-acetyltransferase [Vicinamibacteria bacterium]